MANTVGLEKSIIDYAALLGPDDSHVYHDFLQKIPNGEHSDRSQILESIPRQSSPSYGPLVALSCLLAALPDRWPVLQLQQTITEFWKTMPEEAKCGHATSQVTELLDQVLKQSKNAITSLTDLLHHESPATALIDPETGRSICHRDLADTIRSFVLPIGTIAGARKPVVAISLPNGPLLALTVMATATYYTAAPIAHGVGVNAEQFKSDVLQSRSNMVLVSPADVDRLGVRDDWLKQAKVQVMLISLSETMELKISTLEGSTPRFNRQRPVPNTGNDTGILLFTSGTSGTKKLVPLTIQSMISGVAMVIESWGLSPSMRCLNQMPLNHVGGLVRNIFAPILSGGSIICCSAFDPNLFWDCIEDHEPTWYYASPSMHQGILEAGKHRPESLRKSKIRLICNAAGGLLPSLACQLRDTFSCDENECTILPSYGMTECMPISTPPLDYKLQKTGTSGVSVGPELCILDTKDKEVKPGAIGRIAVRGSPVFSGYLREDNLLDTSCFTEEGWFDTGDMGYLDTEGYLFITGRSKEVINRGGELISPFEIEEAVVAAASNPESRTYERISKALAFSVNHSTLQEVVGIAVVTPKGAKRACLRAIQESVKSSLSAVKVPVLVVYMDDGVPTNNNKVLRIKLAERLGLPEISDTTPQSLRHYEATSPPLNTPLSKSIDCTSLQVTHDCLAMVCRNEIPDAFDVHVRTDASQFYPELLLAPRSYTEEHSDEISSEMLLRRLSTLLHGYNLPYKITHLDEPFPRRRDGSMNDDAMDALVKLHSSKTISTDMTTTEVIVGRIFAEVLALPQEDVSESSDFFGLGGNSMAAGQLLSKLRKEFKLRVGIDLLFKNSEVASLAGLIDEKLLDQKTALPIEQPGFQDALLPGCSNVCSSTNPVLMILQLFPILILYPMKRALTWTIFMYALSVTQTWPTNESIPGRLFDLVLCMGLARISTATVAPIFGIVFKWLLIGKYREGLYPMWGSYHTRWWLCQKVLQITGKGNFRFFNWSRILYSRCLGAKIGKNVSLSEGAELGEFDLITIEDGATLDRCTVRPFAAERNTSMYLGRIAIGANSSIGLKSIVAAGTSIPADTCVGINSSSWETEDADESNRDNSPSQIPGAHWALGLFLGIPIQIFTKFVGAIPWLGALLALVIHEPLGGHDLLRQVMVWFSSPNRVAYHYAALAANSALASTFVFLMVLVLKKAFDITCGTLQPTNADNRSQMTKFRMQIMQKLMPAKQFHKLTEMFGTHYEMTSILARAMGARVGKRVYWPGTGPSLQDISLLDIGDDVVFGSRAHLITSDGRGSDYIRIGNGAMVADRVVVMPGVHLGEHTIMGSGSLTKRGSAYPSATTWVGSKGNNAVCLSSESSIEKDNPIVGHRAAQYHRSVMQQPNTTNSSSTTLVHQFDSESSSLQGNWNPPSYKSVDLEKGQGDLPENTSQSSQEAIRKTESKNSIESSSPFGRAFYEKRASYRVWGQFLIFCYSTFILVTNAIWWNAGSISAMQVIGHHFKHYTGVYRTFLGIHWYRPLSLYVCFTGLIAAIMALQTLLVLGLIIGAKWWLMGTRKAGNYDWDKSPYCQRWQLFLKIETFRRDCYGGHGILGLLTGTRWIALYFSALGATIGKDCALFSGGLPSLMFTEPDLVTLGDRVNVDDASLVAHINTRGKFDLNPLYVGDRSVLRSGSRLLSGAKMEADSCLLEHTLVMAGDVVDAGTTYQGWPAEQFNESRMPTMKPKQIWTLA